MTQTQSAPDQSNATEQAKEQVQQQAGQVKDRAREQVDQVSTQAGERVSTAAGDARSVAEELRKQGKDAPARYAEQAADRAERLGGYLQESDADRILRDVEDLARRQPWAVVAGGLALGFAASRFLKASSSERYRSSTGSGNGLSRPSNGRPANPSAGIPQATGLAAPPQPEPLTPEVGHG